MSDAGAVCILGGGGFLGTALRSHMRDRRVVLVDLRTPSAPLFSNEVFVRADAPDGELSEGLAGTRTCINAAAPIFCDPAPIAEQIAFFLDGNLQPIHRVFPAIAGALDRWVQISSISVYGPAKSGHIREDQRPAPVTPYGVGKLAAESYLTCAARGASWGLVVLRFCDLFGAGARDPRDRRFLAEAIRSARDGTSFEQYGSGAQRRDMLHVSDAARAVVLACDSTRRGTWNVGSGEGYSAREILGALSSLSSPGWRIEGVDVADSPDLVLDSSRFSREFDFAPRVSLADGIRDEYRSGSAGAADT